MVVLAILVTMVLSSIVTGYLVYRYDSKVVVAVAEAHHDLLLEHISVSNKLAEVKAEVEEFEAVPTQLVSRLKALL